MRRSKWVIQEKTENIFGNMEGEYVLYVGENWTKTIGKQMTF